MGTFAIVFVLPEDINITSGSPRHHRNFLDIYLSQYSRSYLLDLIEYQRALKQRNALLKRIRKGDSSESGEHLKVWDENLMRPALKVMAGRQGFIEEIRPRVREISGALSGKSDAIDIAYHPKMELSDYSDLNAALALLAKERPVDLRLGATILGPHRDVIDISFGANALRNFGSMGQKKSVMIAMKLGAYQTLGEHRGEAPILVLDEAFAELDRKRSSALLSLLSDVGQVFLASASMTELATETGIKRFDVTPGAVTERRH